MEEVVPTAIGAFEGSTTVQAVDLSKVQASRLLKSKVPTWSWVRSPQTVPMKAAEIYLHTYF